jgi:hypothetical protein
MKIDRPTAFFDEHGVCFLCADKGDMADGSFAYAATVAQGTNPDTIYFNISTGRVRKVGEIDAAAALAIPDDLGTDPVTLPLPDGVQAVIDGVVHVGTVTLARHPTRNEVIELRGAARGRLLLKAADYRELRRDLYPDQRDQLDALWKALDVLKSQGVSLGDEGDDMLAAVKDIKSRFPKPPK